MAVQKIPVGLGQLLFCEQSAWDSVDTPNVALEAFDIKWTPGRSILPIEPASAYPSRGPKAVAVGAQGGTLSFKTMLRGGNGAESSASKLLKNCGMGRAISADHAAVITAATANTLVALTAGFADIAVGEFVCVKGSSTAQQIRMVTRVQALTPDGTHKTLTVAPNFTATPIPGDALYAIDSFTPSQGEPTKYLSFYLYIGSSATGYAGTGPYYKLVNCAGTWKIGAVGPNALPYIEWTYMVDNWAYVGAAAPTVTADAFTAAHPLLGDKFVVDGVACHIASLSFDPGIKLQPYAATVGTHGRQGWLYCGNDPKLEFVPYYDDTWISTRFSGGAVFTALFESVKSTANFWGLWCPACYLTDLGIEDAGNQHLGHKTTIVLGDPGLDGGGTDPLPRWGLAISGYGT